MYKLTFHKPLGETRYGSDFGWGFMCTEIADVIERKVKAKSKEQAFMIHKSMAKT